MRSPFIVVPSLTAQQVEKWHRQFATDGRDLAEGMWRRSHDAYTERVHGSTPGDRRRRLVHFLDRYEVVELAGSRHLAITESYVYVCSTLPGPDVREYWDRHRRLASRHGWFIEAWGETSFRATHGDYEITGALRDAHPHDLADGTVFPSGYQTVEVTFRSLSEAMEKATRESPWEVWRGSYHRPTPRESPRIVTDLSELLDYFPAHIELGGGPSIEAGIPPLNYFHHTYSAWSKSHGGFAFGATDTLLERIITDLGGFLAEAAEPYKRCFLAQPTVFYETLAKLREMGLLIGPLINNNFDGLAKLAGFEELYVRRYRATTWRPNIQFDPRAKALLVVGLHSDRRGVRRLARARGLQVIIVDPEQCHDDGVLIPYPLEDVATEDIVVNMGANQFAAELTRAMSHPLFAPARRTA
jgi:hypothetical protein